MSVVTEIKMGKHFHFHQTSSRRWRWWWWVVEEAKAVVMHAVSPHPATTNRVSADRRRVEREESCWPSLAIDRCKPTKHAPEL